MHNAAFDLNFFLHELSKKIQNSIKFWLWRCIGHGKPRAIANTEAKFRKEWNEKKIQNRKIVEKENRNQNEQNQQKPNET